MYAILLIGLISIDPPIAEDEVEVVEINHYYNKKGCHVFDQVIWWDWDDDSVGLRVRAWRFRKRLTVGKNMIWFDGEDLRRVKARRVRETWTQYDPEVHDRQFLSQDKRRGLRKCQH